MRLEYHFVRFSIILLAVTAASAEPRPPVLEARWKAPGVQAGGVADPREAGRFFTWGEAAWAWRGGKPVEVVRRPGGFQPGGCVLDAGRPEGPTLVLAGREGEEAGLGTLFAFHPPSFAAQPLDTGAEVEDCLPVTLFGRQGVVTLHRQTQIRFYEWRASGPWPAREIYSIYTASRQGGMAIEDVDGNGQEDLFAGNYWVRAPESFDLPWRIFAIHLHHGTEEAANFSYAAWPNRLVGAQREWDAAPVRIFDRPADPHTLWPERIVPGLTLRRPRAALRWENWAVFGDAGGLVFLDPASGWFHRAAGPPVAAVFVSSGRLYAVSPSEVAVWRR